MSVESVAQGGGEIRPAPEDEEIPARQEQHQWAEMNQTKKYI